MSISTGNPRLGGTEDRFPGELEPELTELLSELRPEQPKPTLWVAGTLPGIMAGKRPPRNPLTPALCR